MELDQKIITKNIPYFQERFRDTYDIDMSTEFASCTSIQLTAYFVKHTGIKVGKLVSFVAPLGQPPGYPPQYFYIRGEISKYNGMLWVDHSCNDITVAWKSKSGRIYEPSDTDIDCNDIEFWFEDLDPVLVHKQLYPKAELPYKLKNLSYELLVHRLNLNMQVTLWLKEGVNANELEQKAIAIIFGFNNISDEALKKGKDYGVVHGVSSTEIEADKIIINIDTGSAGHYFLKHFLKSLSELGVFKKVEIGENAEQ